MLTDLTDLGAAAAKLAGAPLWPVPDADLPALLDAAQRLERCAVALTAHAVRELDTRGIAAAQDRRGLASWLRSRLHLDPRAARRLVDLAEGLYRHREVDKALSTGEVNAAQATAVIDALDALPAEVEADIRDQAQTALVDAAATFEPSSLRRLGGRILHHVAPDRADELEGELLRRQEARARMRRAVYLSAPYEGQVRLSGWLPVDDAAAVRAALDSLTAPETLGDRTPGQARADALTDICRLALRTATLPDGGGEPPQVAVTLSFDPLTSAISRARLDTGEAVTPGTARRIACDARVTPVVLGGDGEVLDAGRSRRLATGALRRALTVRDQGCAFPGCDRPPRWTEAHHIRHWSDGGTTELDNLVLLCGHHHRLVHEGDWQVRTGKDRLPEFVAPAHVDRQRRPRRNIFHRRT